MASLEIIPSTASTYIEFIQFMNKNLIIDGVGACKKDYKDSINIVNVNGDVVNTIKGDSRMYSLYGFEKFTNGGNSVTGEDSKISMAVFAGINSNDNFIFIAPCFYGKTGSGSTTTSLRLTPFFTNDHTSTILYDASGSDVAFSNFKLYRYKSDNIIFFAFDNIQNSIMECTLKNIDDPSITKTILVITDSTGMVGVFDAPAGVISSQNPHDGYPWAVYPVPHQNPNTGKMSTMTLYKYMNKGWYSDELYYYDGGLGTLSNGVSKMGDKKFLKIGNSNFLIKMD